MNIYDLKESKDYKHEYTENALKAIKKFKTLSWTCYILGAIALLITIFSFSNKKIVYLTLVSIIVIKLMCTKIYLNTIDSLKSNIDDSQTYHDFLYYLYRKPRSKSTHTSHLIHIMKINLLKKNYDLTLDAMKMIDVNNLPSFNKVNFYVYCSMYYLEKRDLENFKEYYCKAREISNKAKLLSITQEEVDEILILIFKTIEDSLQENNLSLIYKLLNSLDVHYLSTNEKLKVYIYYSYYYYEKNDLDSFEKVHCKIEKILSEKKLDSSLLEKIEDLEKLRYQISN